MTVSVQSVVLLVVTPCIITIGYQYFGSAEFNISIGGGVMRIWSGYTDRLQERWLLRSTVRGERKG
jgi:hypothetical protein